MLPMPVIVRPEPRLCAHCHPQQRLTAARHWTPPPPRAEHRPRHMHRCASSGMQSRARQLQPSVPPSTGSCRASVARSRRRQTRRPRHRRAHSSQGRGRVSGSRWRCHHHRRRRQSQATNCCSTTVQHKLDRIKMYTSQKREHVNAFASRLLGVDSETLLRDQECKATGTGRIAFRTTRRVEAAFR